jgi:hypothetical protein
MVMKMSNNFARVVVVIVGAAAVLVRSILDTTMVIITLIKILNTLKYPGLLFAFANSPFYAFF